jgi:hypothetical protein
LLRFPGLLAAAALALTCIPCAAAFATESAPSAAVKHAPGKKKPAAATTRPMGAFGISNSLNAPSTDFSQVSPDGDEPRRAREGVAVRPSVGSDGRPAMGLGF